MHTSYSLAIVSGILMMLFGLFFSYQCLDAIGTPHDILNDATLYMQLYFLCMIPGAIYNIGAGILRAVGDSKRPLIAQFVCAILVTIQLMRTNEVYKLTLSKMKFHLPVLKKIIMIGARLLVSNLQCIVSQTLSYRVISMLLVHRQLLHGQFM